VGLLESNSRQEEDAIGRFGVYHRILYRKTVAPQLG